MAKEIKLLEGKAQIEASIKSISNRGKKLDNDIHVAACSILQHIELHGDVTLATKLQEAMPKSARGNALKAWFEEYGKVVWNNDEKKYDYAKAKSTLLDDVLAADGSIDAIGAKNNPFWVFQPEKAYVPFDLEAYLQKGLKQAQQKAKANPKDQGAVTGAATLEYMLDLLAKAGEAIATEDMEQADGEQPAPIADVAEEQA